MKCQTESAARMISFNLLFGKEDRLSTRKITMNSHKLAVIDSFSRKYQEVKVTDDYVFVMSPTLQIQVSIYTFCLS